MSKGLFFDLTLPKLKTHASQVFKLLKTPDVQQNRGARWTTRKLVLRVISSKTCRVIGPSDVGQSSQHSLALY